MKMIKSKMPEHFKNNEKCFLFDNCMYQMNRYAIPTLYRICIRIIARNIEQCNCDNWDLSELPSTIKTDLLNLNMKFLIGFTNANTFIQLLTPNITHLTFVSSVLTDTMLQCIGERCKYLRELYICGSNRKRKELHISSDGLSNCMKNLKSLQSFQIINSDKVNDNTIEIISQNCPHLKSLWLDNCKNITDQCSKSLKSIELNDLNLSNTGITNQWLFDLTDSTLMESLRDISLRNCKVSHEGLKCLNWKRLKNINIIGVKIRDLTFIPATANYQTLNWSI